MKLSIKNSIYQAILNSKWLDISYVNKKEESTDYYIGIKDIDIDKEGKDIMIGFNPRFVLDVLRVVDDETINIYLVNPRSPFIIRNDDGSYLYLILPISFNM